MNAVNTLMKSTPNITNLSLVNSSSVPHASSNYSKLITPPPLSPLFGKDMHLTINIVTVPPLLPLLESFLLLQNEVAHICRERGCHPLDDCVDNSLYNQNKCSHLNYTDFLLNPQKNVESVCKCNHKNPITSVDVSTKNGSESTTIISESIFRLYKSIIFPQIPNRISEQYGGTQTTNVNYCILPPSTPSSKSLVTDMVSSTVTASNSQVNPPIFGHPLFILPIADLVSISPTLLTFVMHQSNITFLFVPSSKYEVSFVFVVTITIYVAHNIYASK
jgi:hypothetical protein